MKEIREMDKCPGREQKLRAMDVLEVQCPTCGKALEFFSDEQRKCPECGQLVVNNKQADA
jgi:endogenous inhibitor of DNA gyrase (YacG/DUF329 family)